RVKRAGKQADLRCRCHGGPSIAVSTGHSAGPPARRRPAAGPATATNIFSPPACLAPDRIGVFLSVKDRPTIGHHDATTPPGGPQSRRATTNRPGSGLVRDASPVETFFCA